MIHKFGYTAARKNGENRARVLMQAEEFCRNSAQENPQPKWLYRYERFAAV
jgi:hypothetical protein